LSSCATQRLSIQALTVQRPGCDLTAARTNGELQDCAAVNRLELKKANADKARIQELIQPKHWWEKLFFWK
jgi:hypothetical protein